MTSHLAKRCTSTKTLYVYEMHVSNIHSVVTHEGILSVLLLILEALWPGTYITFNSALQAKFQAYTPQFLLLNFVHFFG